MTFPPSLVNTLNSFEVQLPSVAGLPQPITGRSIAHFFYAILCAWLLLVSFTGWGRATGRLLQLRRLPVSVACSLGIATVLFLGGLLNISHAIYPEVLFALVVFGLLSYVLLRNDVADAYRWSELWNRSPRWAKLLLILALVTLALRLAGTVRMATFNSFDDGPAYMVFPQKMLAAHHFAFDPFSDRRVISSLGGGYLLQSILIAATSLAHIGMADRTLGLLLLFPAILDLGIAFELSPVLIAALGWVVFMVPQETWNLTYIVLPIPLFLSVLWVIFQASEPSELEIWRSAAIAGAVGGAILLLKSSFLPYLGSLIIVSFVLLAWTRRKGAIQFPVIEGLACLLIMAPWMISMKHDSGTYLFPVLGHGVDYSSYGLFEGMSRFTSTRAVLRSFVQGSALLFLAGVQYLAGLNDRRSRLSFFVLIAAAISITVFNYSSGGDYIWRYNFAQFFTAVILFAASGAAAFSTGPAAGKSRVPAVLAMLSLIGCIFYYDVGGGSLSSFSQIGEDFAQYRCAVRASLSGQTLATPAMVAEYQAAERSIPVGATALESLSRPFLFDYRAGRTILLADWAGGAGPRPGWDFDDGAQGTAKYLLGQNVHYVVYDYHSVDSVQFCRTFTNLQHYSELDHRLELLAILAHHQFDQLRATHKSIYDDGKLAVIDLKTATPTLHPLLSDWTLHTSETAMCSQIAQDYMTIPAAARHRENFRCE